ncbi:MAG: type II toxin-antitoxin system HicA family toxin [Nitrososphaerota archaeon]|nr:type II toxin-antitoxin system HicA family toxin [Nitrososphaerota archaeon]MDG6941176.1 type II toxin-antitoxin system HicA family toxin [Nitrososphaerota archaeon]MDG6985039.1 type II toxin-antitoxin system HicA family toxin [Nitrososphaerota archaeon]MDG6992267.1 type II toxin-antitoxin system HicA family toxin [Nitrososphaerota archaeon]MDG7032407.1 type II toxin-antitoxin system HicA family toxin [Nitrososphaerota archaeon]
MSDKRLPVASWRDVLKVLSRKGFFVVRQSGSHIALSSSDGKRRVIVPRHDGIKPGTLLSIIEQAGLTKDTFVELLG